MNVSLVSTNINRRVSAAPFPVDVESIARDTFALSNEMEWGVPLGTVRTLVIHAIRMEESNHEAIETSERYADTVCKAV